MTRFSFLMCVLPLAISVAACASTTPRVEEPAPADPALIRHCDPFEVEDFEPRNARSLKGTTWVKTYGPAVTLEGVQVAARDLASDTVYLAISAPTGHFSLEGLPPSRYEVWTCLDGYDELHFELQIDPKSKYESLDLFIGLSESGGIRDVVPRLKQ